jgi:ABC-type molybdate transport system ATPase subunit
LADPEAEHRRPFADLECLTFSALGQSTILWIGLEFGAGKALFRPSTKAGIFLRPEHRRVGLLFQDYCLFPHLRVKANIMYGMRRRPTKGISLDRVIKALELTDILDRYPSSISGRQKERVALALNSPLI